MKFGRNECGTNGKSQEQGLTSVEDDASNNKSTSR